MIQFFQHVSAQLWIAEQLQMSVSAVISPFYDTGSQTKMGISRLVRVRYSA
jgi:hypothetical protein